MRAVRAPNCDGIVPVNALLDRAKVDTWGTARKECDWLGVTCRKVAGLVDGLQLEGIVRGLIPDDLALLTDLTFLEFSLSDQLVGTIPSSLGQHLTALTALNLLSN